MPLDQIDVDELDNAVEKEMSFLEHLEELRWHLLRSLIAILLGAIVIFVLGSSVFDDFIFWCKSESFPTYKLLCHLSERFNLGDAGCLEPPQFEIITTTLQEKFITHLKVSLILGFVVAFPYVFWEIWKFISPGLKQTERRYSQGAVFVCSFLFFTGVSFGYFVICPFAVSFFTNYEMSEYVISRISLSSLVSSITMFTIPAGIVFQLPVAVYFLSKVGFITPGLMRKFRKHSFVAILLLSAFITPPDVISQFFIGIPIYVLYEISIFISGRVVKNQNEENQNELTKTK